MTIEIMYKIILLLTISINFIRCEEEVGDIFDCTKYKGNSKLYTDCTINYTINYPYALYGEGYSFIEYHYNANGQIERRTTYRSKTHDYKKRRGYGINVYYAHSKIMKHIWRELLYKFKVNFRNILYDLMGLDYEEYNHVSNNTSNLCYYNNIINLVREYSYIHYFVCENNRILITIDKQYGLENFCNDKYYNILDEYQYN